MPIASERVINRPLAGHELKRLILADLDRLVDAEGLLSPHIAFGRCAYTLTLVLHVDNAFQPESKTSLSSKALAKVAVEESPELAAIEAAPLADLSPDAVMSATTLERRIESPNEERLRAGLPIPVDRRQQDSTVVTEMVAYPPDPSIGEGNVRVSDVTEGAKIDWEAARAGKVTRLAPGRG